VEDQIAEGDKVVTRVTFHRTHRGQFDGIAPTRKQVKWLGTAMDRIADGKVIEM
jgi:predicted ester cyclase